MGSGEPNEVQRALTSIISGIRDIFARDEAPAGNQLSSPPPEGLEASTKSAILNAIPPLKEDVSRLLHNAALPIPGRLELDLRPSSSCCGDVPWDLDVPLTLRLCGSNSGRPDLRLDVIGFHTGDAVPYGIRTTDSTATALEASGRLLQRVGGYLLLQLALPDTWPHVMHHMAAFGTCISLSQLAFKAMPAQMRRKVRRATRQVRQGLPPALAAASNSVFAGMMGVCLEVQQYCTPAVILGLAALAVSTVHPPTFEILKCIAATLPVQAGYNHTARDVASGKIPPGWRQEAAWRARHKWAAQRLAHLLTDLYDRAPLGPVLDVVDGASFNIGLPLEGQAINSACEGLDGGQGWGAPSFDSQFGFWGSFRLPLVDEGQPRGVASSGRTQAAIPNAGTIATVPADVLHSRSPHLAGVPSLLNGGGASFSGTATTLDGVVAMPSTSAFAPALVAPVVGLAGGTLGEAAGVPYSSDVVQGQQSWVQQRVSRSASGGLPGDQGSGTGPPDRAEPRTDGLLPGVDTTVEGFETSLLPTIRNAADLQAYARGARPQLNSPFSAAAQQGPEVEGRGAHPHISGSSGSLNRATTAELLQLKGNEWEENAENLPLYGRADHLGVAALPPLPFESVIMAFRAIYLIAAFLPFLLFGPLLLLLSGLILRIDRTFSRRPTVTVVSAVPASAALAPALPAARGRVANLVAGAETPYTFETRSNRSATRFRRRRRRDRQRAVGEDEGIGERRAWSSVEEMMEKAPESLGMSDRLGSMATLSQESRARSHLPAHSSVVEAAAAACRYGCWNLLLQAIRSSGAAFIKWGQWSATREDIFPEELCVALSELHDRAPEHSWWYTRREIEAAFGCPVDELFASIEETPLASGSIAQVHRAVLKVGSKRRNVVVKVRHPGVACQIAQDFQLLQPIAGLTSQVRSLKGLSIKESLAQFSASMTAQADLRVEYVHLRRFFRNFLHVRKSVTPPLPIPGLCTASVLVETYEPGDSVAKYIREPAPFNTQIVALGVDAYLKMVLADNFVHTDLHPGNILVRLRGQVGVDEAATADQVKGRLQLVLLDFGLAEELSPPVRRHFISFLHCACKGDGERGAYHMLKFGAVQQCPSPAAFTADMVALFRRECNIYSPLGINLDTVMKHSLQLARKHEVTVDSGYAALVIGCCVVVGFATALDPNVNLVDAATPTLLVHNLTGRQFGRLYT